MKKCILLLLLAVHLNASGQVLLSKMKPMELTAQQDSIVRSFAQEYKPLYAADGHFLGYMKLDASAPSSKTSIMLQHNRIPYQPHSIMRPGECSFLVLDPPPLFEQWGWTKPATFL